MSQSQAVSKFSFVVKMLVANFQVQSEKQLPVPLKKTANNPVLNILYLV